jgi:hypothetical protein
METRYQDSRWTIPLKQRPLVREALQSDVDQIEARRAQRRLVREICSLPEVRALSPERFITAFKIAVNDAATELGIAEGRDREQLLSRLVSLSIEEFFQKDAGDAIRSAPTRPWSERLHLSAVRHSSASHHKSKGDSKSGKPRDEDCRGSR